MTDLELAKGLLLRENHTCVLCRGDKLYTSDQRGVKPLVGWLEAKETFLGFSAADKVVGKATAFLYVLLEVKAVFARVISQSALQVLTKHQILVQYEALAEHIINRRGDGICPFEEAVLAVEEPDTAYRIIREKMAEMNDMHPKSV